MQWRSWQQWLCAVFVISTMMNVTAADKLPGYETYLVECSKCHGQLDGRAARQVPMTIAAGSSISFASDEQQLSFALPYGPTLRGIIGRRAGSVDGYDYSKAFLRAMRDTTWDADSIDDYITDSQQRAPGARMFYRMPDAGVRRRVIEFLSAFE